MRCGGAAGPDAAHLAGRLDPVGIDLHVQSVSADGAEPVGIVGVAVAAPRGARIQWPATPPAIAAVWLVHRQRPYRHHSSKARRVWWRRLVGHHERPTVRAASTEYPCPGR